MRGSVFTFLTCAAVLVTGLTGCGRDRTGGPRGTPAAVVAASPDKTLRAVRASVETATSDTTGTGWVDFVGRKVHVEVAGRQAGRPPVLLTDPLLAVEVLRGATNIVEYGGVEVRGASTIRYQFDVDPTRAVLGPLVTGLRSRTFYADAWIDGQGRVRQVLVPADLNESRPRRRSTRVPQVITVQFFDYAQEAAR